MGTRAFLPTIALSLATLLGTSASTAFAQARVSGFAIGRYEPSERGSDWFVNESLDLRGRPLAAGGLTIDWAYRPLVLYDPSNIQGNPLANAITEQVVIHAGGAVLLHDRYRIGIDVPLLVFQDGEDLSKLATTQRSPDKGALGDLRLAGDVRILGKYGDPFSAAVGAQVYFPTGNRSLFTSDGTMRITPRLLVAGDFEGMVYATKLGFAYRPLDATFDGRPLGSEAIFSAALGVKANDRFVFGPELLGSTVVTGGDRPFRTRNTPLELLLGGHVMVGQHWKAGSAIGPGFTRGDGNPSMRVLLSFEAVPDLCLDPDGDGICSDADACPSVDGLPKDHGCPADRDYDGFNDPDDACPDQAGPRTANPKTTGCPDRDFDGVADLEDACLDVAGVATSDPKTNGCPKVEAAPAPAPATPPGSEGVHE